MLTQEYVRQRYDYRDGELIAKFTKGKVRCGDTVGTNVDKDGYKRTSILDRPRPVHRLIFLWHHGYLPKMIDHINGNRQDNRIENLRAADPVLNSCNLEKHRKGVPAGVSWHKRDEQWQAYWTVNKKRVYLGYFATMEEAHNALLKFTQERK